MQTSIAMLCKPRPLRPTFHKSMSYENTPLTFSDSENKVFGDSGLFLSPVQENMKLVSLGGLKRKNISLGDLVQIEAEMAKKTEKKRQSLRTSTSSDKSTEEEDFLEETSELAVPLRPTNPMCYDPRFSE